MGAPAQKLSAPKDDLLRKIWDRSAKVGVVGLGYVGLPLAVQIAGKGYQVQGIEISRERHRKILKGESYIKDVSSEEVKKLVKGGQLSCRDDYKLASDQDIILVTVPTPLSRNLTPDLTFVIEACQSIAQHIRSGQLISLESTTYPGTTEQVALPLLEKKDLKIESDFFLVHSPERVDPGNSRFKVENTPKVIGGVGTESLEVGVAFYSQFITRVVPVSSAWNAELVKIFENTFRAVNIALVNELTMLCDRMGLNVWEILEAAFTKPFGIMPFFPGPGVGGHCIPLDPHYLEWKAREHHFNTQFIALAGDTNRKMPRFTVEKAFRVLNRAGAAPSRSTVLVLGVAYKKDSDEARESPAVEVIRLLRKEGVNVVYHDPKIARIDEEDFSLASVELSDDTVAKADLVLIATEHTSIDYRWLVNRAKHVFDTRNATRDVQDHRDKITLL